MSHSWDRTHPQALWYYALASPVIIIEILLLSISISHSNPILASVQPPQYTVWLEVWLVSAFLQLVSLAPWILIAASLYALFSARPSTLIILQTVLLLFVASTVGQVDFFVAASVVLSSFTTLVGFNYLRAARVLSGRALDSESRGPPLLRAVTFGFDFILPVSAALGTMAIVALVMSLVTAQVKILPEPLATLGGLYLESNLYLILTTITVAGGVVWAMRELVEPVVMRYTMSRADAEEMAFSQITDIARKVWSQSRKKSSTARSSLYLSLAAASLILLILIFSQGPGPIFNDFLSTVGVIRNSASRPEVLAENSAKNIVKQIDHWAATLESIARFIIKLLWG